MFDTLRNEFCAPFPEIRRGFPGDYWAIATSSTEAIDKELIVTAN
jgi:hypothetical protein